ncbi:hypothetical protein GAY33_04320 [Azospirillum brasilense]|uniref:hypothetical protein n=1 Tax=Azospirillum argentinense TaxID=2970906 RepID=UPI00190B91D5|nr:hypothetical protein [Azospirillum argentinense]MBK3798464.1 hypothetical protein [Azospirillum argentinense]
MKRSTAALLAAALLGSVSSAPAMAGPDSTSIRPPPVGSAPLRASSAARADTSDVSARALLLDSNATIDGSRITGTVQSARTSLEANQASGLAAGATINGSQVTGTVANAANASTASQAYSIWDARTNTWQWVNNVSVTRADSSGYSDTAGTAGTAGQANQLYNNYTGGYDWASNLRVGVATTADRASSAGVADRTSQAYFNGDAVWHGGQPYIRSNTVGVLADGRAVRAYQLIVPTSHDGASAGYERCAWVVSDGGTAQITNGVC